MSLSPNQIRTMAAAREIRTRGADLEDAIATLAPPFSTIELPPLCDAENPSDPKNPELVICYILARINYLMQYIGCASSVNPPACAEAACNLYHDAVTQCEVQNG